jgi:hypothetical protein
MQELQHRIFLNGGTHVDVVPVARRKAERAKAEQRAKDAHRGNRFHRGAGERPRHRPARFSLRSGRQRRFALLENGRKPITHWHGTDEGFAGRKLIDERIARSKKTN